MYTVKESIGLHTRPAGMRNKETRRHKSAMIIHAGARNANILRLMAVLQPGVKCGDTVKITVESEDGDVAAPIVEEFFKAKF